MIRCPRCDVEVEPTWERCAGCGLATEDVTLGDLTRDLGSMDRRATLRPHTPPPYRDERSPGPPSSAVTVVALAVLVVVLAVVWLAHPFGALVVWAP